MVNLKGRLHPSGIKIKRITKTILPRWLSESNLGSKDNRQEVIIPLEYSDPSNSITGFELSSGNLPPGYSLNVFDGSISGSADATSSQTYYFQITILTLKGDRISKDFYIFINTELTKVVWLNESNLGTVDSGSTYNTELKAVSVPNV